MKTKMIFKDFQISNVPNETIVVDVSGKHQSCVMLDDVSEKRWKIIFKIYQALKITAADCMDLDYRKGGDFPDDCFDDKEGFPVPQFRKHIMEVENSKWIKELKKALKKVDSSADFMDKARHFLIPCYDYIIEIIAWDLELEEVKD